MILFSLYNILTTFYFNLYLATLVTNCINNSFNNKLLFKIIANLYQT